MGPLRCGDLIEQVPALGPHWIPDRQLGWGRYIRARVRTAWLRHASNPGPHEAHQGIARLRRIILGLQVPHHRVKCQNRSIYRSARAVVKCCISLLSGTAATLIYAHRALHAAAQMCSWLCAQRWHIDLPRQRINGGFGQPAQTCADEAQLI